MRRTNSYSAPGFADAHGARVAKLIDGVVTERYEWAGSTRLLATYGADGTLTRRYLYADARTPYAVDTTSGRYYLHYDQVGSLRAMSDEEGVTRRLIDYDSFGVTLSDSDPALDVALGFAGGLQDTDTGLVHFGARDYDPSTGRWTSVDPIGLSGGDVNLYGYCLSDPVGLVDPAGLESLSNHALEAIDIYNHLISDNVKRVTGYAGTAISGGTVFFVWYGPVQESNRHCEMLMEDNLELWSPGIERMYALDPYKAAQMQQQLEETNRHIGMLRVGLYAENFGRSLDVLVGQ